VGSTNPVKIRAVKEALWERFDELVVEGVEVESGVSDQPMSDDETKKGAIERAKRALEKKRADFGVGLEGGVFKEDGELWNTVWCVALDKEGRRVVVNGEKFVLPKKLAEEILGGGEMGLVMNKLTGRENVKHQEGMLGVVTDGLVPRIEAYKHLVRLAVGQLLVKDWY